MRNCVILGSGRSGTSMLAGMLHPAGYYMGDHLLPATPSNPKGYFESSEINDLNNDLLTPVVTTKPAGLHGYLYPWRLSTGLLWLADVDVSVEVSPTSQQLAQISRLVSKSPFCFKDPRFCYTLKAWRPALDEVVFLCVFREPGRTVSSMKKDVREQYRRERYSGFYLTQDRALRAWTSMYRHVLDKHSREGPWLFAHYNQILDGSAISQIEELIDARVDAGFVDPALKRSQNGDDLPPQTAQVYRRLCALAGYTDE